MTPQLFTVGVAGLATIAGLLSVVWIAAVRRRDASLVDVWWGPGFAILAGVYTVGLGAWRPRPLLIDALVIVWGARLGWHLATRRTGAEDPRYAAMRAAHGDAFWWRSLFLVFWLQAVLIWFIGLPILATAGAAGDPPLGRTDLGGVLVFAVGFGIEAVGDWQLRRFRADAANRGRVLDRGLWRYTRHPNYFGDALLWWGVYLMAASTRAGRLTVLSPALMTFLLLRVSGVTLLERNLRASKPDYARYVERTSAFVPWFPG